MRAMPSGHAELEKLCGAKWQLASKCWVWPGNEDRVRISEQGHQALQS